MRQLNRLWALVPVFALLSAPALSCLVPQQLLGERYSDCCRQMGNRCDSKGMSSQQSCCESTTETGQPYISSTMHVSVSAGVATAVLPVVPGPTPPVVSLHSAAYSFH